MWAPNLWGWELGILKIPVSKVLSLVEMKTSICEEKNVHTVLTGN
jgi:hypothetical protein